MIGKKSLQSKASFLKGSMKILNFHLKKKKISIQIDQKQKGEGTNYHNGNESRGIAINPMELKKTKREHCTTSYQ